MPKLSIIVPVYFNEDTLYDLYEELNKNVFSKLDEYELIFVDDGSLDNSYNIMRDIAKKDNNVKLIKLSRNFGEHAAILAGLINSTGQCAVTKQADLQEDSKLILDMYDKYKEGNKVVIAARLDRQDGLIKKFFAKLYYMIIRKVAFKNMPKGGFDCFLVDRQVIEVLKNLDEKNSSLILQILWLGFNPAIVEFSRKDRKKGRSMWTFSKKIKLFLDSLISFSIYPIKMISFFGLFIFLFSIFAAIYLIYSKIVNGEEVIGWTSTIIVITTAFGMIMFTLGMIGEYLYRILEDVRNRPVYVIDKIENSK